MNTPSQKTRVPFLFLFMFTALFASWATEWPTPVDARQRIEVDLFDPGYLAGDSNYHSLTIASDGNVYFTVNTHHPFGSARLFRFNPETEEVTLLGDVNTVLGEDVRKQVPHGKIHTPLFEHDGYLYFATHTSYYDGNLPRMIPDDGRRPYPGGHFMRFNMESGSFEDLAHLGLASEGIITMALDPTSETLYGLTWPTGLLISYNLDEGQIRNWGAVHERGEWGRLPEEWDFICRRLGIDPEGNLYGATDTGRIWHFERGKQRPVNYLDGLTLDTVPPVRDGRFVYQPEPHFFWRNWRTILWNPNTDSFWGLHGGSTQLFEFDPAAQTLRSVASMRVGAASPGQESTSADSPQRNPFRTQLGLTLGPGNTLYYLAHGPPLAIDGRRDVQTSVHLLTYPIDDSYSGDTIDHGVLVGPDNRRVFFTESIAIHPNGDIYTVAWVETVDETRMAQIQQARGAIAPDETRDVIYEIQLVRIPAAAR